MIVVVVDGAGSGEAVRFFFVARGHLGGTAEVVGRLDFSDGGGGLWLEVEDGALGQLELEAVRGPGVWEWR